MGAHFGRCVIIELHEHRQLVLVSHRRVVLLSFFRLGRPCLGEHVDLELKRGFLLIDYLDEELGVVAVV
jgi:hypothetical protein